MPSEIDLSVVATLLLLGLVLAYGAALGALVMWLGKTDEPPARTMTAERSSFRQAA